MINESDYFHLSFLNYVSGELWEAEVIEESMDALEGIDLLMTILNRSGAPSLTVCPECHVDDFIHVEGCKLGERCRLKHVEYGEILIQQRLKERAENDAPCITDPMILAEDDIPPNTDEPPEIKERD